MRYIRSEPTRTYTYNGRSLYGAGDLFAVDSYLDSDFRGDAIAQLIGDGFTIKGDELISPYTGKAIARFEDTANE